MFAEVILPLPLYSTFTYSIPQDMEKDVQVGSRVLVQFGKKKFYTAIVEAIHSNQPKNYEVKPISAPLDSAPIVRYPQVKLWHWIADYYLCAPGEVFKAAVPTGLKPESETYISLNPDYEPDESSPFTLSERQAILIQHLQEKKRMKIAEIEAETSFKNVASLVSQLLEQSIVEIDEKVVERYRPKKVSFVRLKAERGDSERIHEFFSLVTRSRQQESTHRLPRPFRMDVAHRRFEGRGETTLSRCLRSESGCIAVARGKRDNGGLQKKHQPLLPGFRRD